MEATDKARICRLLSLWSRPWCNGWICSLPQGKRMDMFTSPGQTDGYVHFPRANGWICSLPQGKRMDMFTSSGQTDGYVHFPRANGWICSLPQGKRGCRRTRRSLRLRGESVATPHLLIKPSFSPPFIPSHSGAHAAPCGYAMHARKSAALHTQHPTWHARLEARHFLVLCTAASAPCTAAHGIWRQRMASAWR